MPTYTRNKKRGELVFVPINDLVFFGFKTKDFSALPGISASSLTAIGHVKIGGAIGITIIGAKAPTPPRVKRKIPNANPGQQQSISTYCAYNKLAAAIGGGNWTLAKKSNSVKLRAASSSSGSMTAIAEMSDTSLYCFSMSKADFEDYGLELGLKSATNVTTDTERKKLVSGSSTPRPGKAAKKLEDGSTFTSFYSAGTNVLDAGYSVIGEEKVLVPF